MKSLKESCQFTYNNLGELDDLIRVYVESKLKTEPEGDVEFDFDFACEVMEAMSFASGRILMFSAGLGEKE